MSTYNICFHGEIKENIMRIPPLIWSYASPEMELSTNRLTFKRAKAKSGGKIHRKQMGILFPGK